MSKTTNSKLSRSMHKPVNQWIFRIIIITIVIFLFFTFATRFVTGDFKFIKKANITSMMYQMADVGTMAIAIMFAFVTGGIDLSVVGVANFSGVVCAMFLTKQWMIPGMESDTQIMIIGMIAGILTGMFAGFINGFCVTQLKITPMLATLGTQSIFTGAAMIITRGSVVPTFPSNFQYIGGGSFFGGWLPFCFLLMIFLYIITFILMEKTTFGQRLYLYGANKRASYYTGQNNKLLGWTAYVMNGFLAAFGGIILISKNNSARADYATTYSTLAMIIIILGGVSPSGGVGRVIGIFFGLLSTQFISSGLNLIKVTPYFKECLWGAMLVLVLIIDYYSTNGFQKKRRKPKAPKAPKQAPAA
ncbi:ABC transporter permease [Feifania hominis]|uniref:ABC transporter permease n=1 Tax=Feifania hominis TaxID=2763660 RepID=A0A926DB57_9FIRM|nr:ABC transporter permease [Feifania hominis]MBC8535765.1 ABC transporter permease [Feifania hominis]